jgi:hypothetical protein
MFASVTASSSCEAALSLCTEIADCSVSVLACDGADRYDVTLITHTDTEQKPYLSVSYYPGGL